MLVAIVWAQLWGVLQLILIGSLTRTFRVRTILAAMAVGFYVCAPVAMLLQIAWIYPVAWMIDTPVYLLTRSASYTVDPFIEEIVKVAPVIVLVAIPTIRRQLSITDCVLVGASAGSGFGLAEALYRCGTAADNAVSVETGWILATGLALPEVPSIGTTLSSWLPPGVASGDVFFPGIDGMPWLNLHLAWSAVGGLAVGLAALRGGKLVRRWGAGLLVYVALDHASWNAVIAGGSTTQQVLELWLFTTLRDLLGFLPIAALVVAWWFDRHQQRDYARDRIKGKRLPAWTPDIWLAQMRSPVVLFGLLLMAPSILWFVGGWPQTSSLQTLMTASVFWILVLMLSLANQSWTAWRVFEHGRSWPKTLRLPKGDDIAFSGLRLACGAGAVGLAGYALMRSFSGLAPQGDLFDFHVLEAVSHLRNVAALMFGGIALAFVGPSVGEAAGVAEEVGVVEAASVGEAAAVGGLAAGGAIAAGAAAGVLVGPTAGYVIGHAEELRNLPDADEVSRVAGAPPDSKPDGGTPYREPTPPVPNPDVDPEPYFPGPGEPGWPGNPPEEPKTPPPPPTEPVPPKPAEPKTFPDRPRRTDPSPFVDPEKKDP